MIGCGVKNSGQMKKKRKKRLWAGEDLFMEESVETYNDEVREEKGALFIG